MQDFSRWLLAISRLTQNREFNEFRELQWQKMAMNDSWLTPLILRAEHAIACH